MVWLMTVYVISLISTQQKTTNRTTNTTDSKNYK